MLVPPSVPYLSSRPSADGRVVLFGAPLDLTETFRRGTHLAPDRIRVVSDVLESYSPTLRRDLSELDLADAGNLDLDGLEMGAALARIEGCVAAVRRVGFPIMLGGEHTASLAAFAAIKGRFPDAALLHVDAHLDMRESYLGVEVGHATWLYHVGRRWGLENVIQLGVRSGTREEYQLAADCAYSSPGLTLPSALRETFARRQLYVTIDIDVLDPSCAPGTGCPEPGGARFDELLTLLYSLHGLPVVGMDVVEVLPAVDHGDITSVAAAKLVREAALLFG